MKKKFIIEAEMEERWIPHFMWNDWVKWVQVGK